MFILGLTGGIGCGKTTVANVFMDLGIHIVDADMVAREVVEPGKPALTEIVNKFGEDILQEGRLNRAKLREHIFNNNDDKQWLNNLLHPIIRQQLFKQLNQGGFEYAILVAPLLFENKLETKVDRVLVIDIPEHLQVERTLARDNVSKEQVASIIQAQIARPVRLAKADDVLKNNGSLSELKCEITQLHQNYLALARNKALHSR